MRRCEDCKLVLEDDVRFCPSCGKGVALDRRLVTTTSAEVGALLTSANLHRIRSEWDEAVADATEALKIDPENPDIASLLGSIYEQRRMFGDAIIWYEMAVDLNPSSDEDRSRLERVKQHIAEQRKNRTDSFGVFQKRTKIWAAVMGGVFLLIVIFAFVVMAGRGKNRESTEIKMDDRPRAVGLGAGVSSTASDEAGRSSRSLPTSTDLAGTPQAGSGLRTQPEMHIRDKVDDAEAVQKSKASIDDVIADPRSGVAIVTFSMPSDGRLTRDSVMLAAGAIADATFAAHKQVQFVTARCIMSSGNVNSTQVAFIGDIARSSFQGMPETPTAQQIQGIITNPYWNPALQQP